MTSSVEDTACSKSTETTWSKSTRNLSEFYASDHPWSGAHRRRRKKNDVMKEKGEPKDLASISSAKSSHATISSSGTGTLGPLLLFEAFYYNDFTLVHSENVTRPSLHYAGDEWYGIPAENFSGYWSATVPVSAPQLLIMEFDYGDFVNLTVQVSQVIPPIVTIASFTNPQSEAVSLEQPGEYWLEIILHNPLYFVEWNSYLDLLSGNRNGGRPYLTLEQASEKLVNLKAIGPQTYIVHVRVDGSSDPYNELVILLDAASNQDSTTTPHDSIVLILETTKSVNWRVEMTDTINTNNNLLLPIHAIVYGSREPATSLQVNLDDYYQFPIPTFVIGNDNYNNNGGISSDGSWILEELTGGRPADLYVDRHDQNAIRISLPSSSMDNTPQQQPSDLGYDLSTFDARYYDGTTLVREESGLARPAMNYPWDDFYGITSEDFRAIWNATLVVLTDHAQFLDIEFSLSWSTVTLEINGQRQVLGQNDDSTLVEFEQGRVHEIIVEYENNWHTVGFNSFFGKRQWWTLDEATTRIDDNQLIDPVTTYIVHVHYYESDDLYQEILVLIDPPLLLGDQYQSIFLILESYNSINWRIENPTDFAVDAIVFGSYEPATSVEMSTTETPVFAISDGLTGTESNDSDGQIRSLTGGRDPHRTFTGYATNSVRVS
ncbi:expressed unknown protein [Seminavis robusta]|uniref:PA14 domain-containing protein n=1 Tax=Seminavis robusta TaxID=568900 RepID=A0A9N8HQD9_9STRA|nr:expressed unknown protein [Seminavis robusta]|eukprot:Sro1185_g250210.1 n/a (661) ;mRNA; f:18432-20414